MTFSVNNDGKFVCGSKEVSYGRFTNAGGDTGGEVTTLMSSVDTFMLQHTGSAVTTNAPVANETFPLAKGAVTIVTDDGEDGLWIAIGKFG